MTETIRPRHSFLVRVTHWLTVLSFLALLVTGVEITISHPRFYWGETGNVNMRPLFTIPIPSSRSSVPTGYGYVLPDQNGWSRYLHFQSAWLVVGTGLLFVAGGICFPLVLTSRPSGLEFPLPSTCVSSDRVRRKPGRITCCSA